MYIHTYDAAVKQDKKLQKEREYKKESERIVGEVIYQREDYAIHLLASPFPCLFLSITRVSFYWLL